MIRNPIPAIRVLIQTFYPYRWHIAMLVVLGFVSGILAGVGIGSLVPLLSFLLGGEAQAGSRFTIFVKAVFSYLPFSYGFRTLLFLIVGLFIFRAVVMAFFNYIRAWVRFHYKRRVTSDLLEGMFAARWTHLMKQKMGVVQNMFILDVHYSAQILEFVSQVVLSYVSAAVFIFFAAMISFRVTLLTAVAGVFMFIIFRVMARKTKRTSRMHALQEHEVSQFFSEHMAGIKTVKLMAAAGPAFRRGEGSIRELTRLAIKKTLLRSFSAISAEPMSIVVIAYVFAFSYNTPGFNLQVFAATMLLVQRIFVYLDSGQAALHGIDENIVHLFQITRFQNLLREAREGEAGKRKFQFSRTLEFRDVSFSFGEDREVLKHIDFNLKKGEMIGLIGPSGSGKTSIADLVLRLLEPQAGIIALDSIDSREFNLTEWRAHIGYVAQDLFLLNDTIANNISFYKLDMTQDEMEDAARQANILDFVHGLKDGFQTVVGDRGVMLSGGQRQRVVLARVLARKPPILILDEATSALDNESETLIQQSIDKLRGKVTVLVIAHRLSTVMDMERLFILDQGRIVEEGKPGDLLKNPESYFSRMHALKSG